MPRTQSPSRARDDALAVLTALRNAGHEAYFAGGCVRDELLGLHPTDYDVATSATPAQVASLFPAAQHVGASFGVVIVPQGHGAARSSTEVATFRADGTYSDARRPDAVTFSDKHADAQRRDFTINALFLDPLAPSEPFATAPTSAPPAPSPTPSAHSATSPLGGTVIDLVNGLQDLRSRTLRAVGDPAQRLAEDHLRALRAVRFAARLDLTIDPATSAAIKADAAQLKGVSRERIGDELRRMMLHPSRARAAELMQAHTLDAPALDEPTSQAALTRLRALPEPGATAIPGSQHAFPGERPAPVALYPAIALAAWSLDRAPPGTDHKTTASRLRRALCLSNDESAALLAVLEHHAALCGSWLDAPVALQKRAIARAGFSEAWHLFAAENAVGARNVLEVVDRHRKSGSGVAPEPLLKGDDLVRLGVKSGPLFKKVLDAVYDLQLEDGFALSERPHGSAVMAAERMIQMENP